MNDKENYKCLKCDKEFARRQSLFNHTKNCGKLQVETFSCSQFDEVFTRKDTLFRHVRKFCKSNSNKTRNTFICSGCNKTFDRKKDPRDMQKLICQRTNWYVPEVCNTSEKTNSICIKQHVNPMKTKVEQQQRIYSVLTQITMIWVQHIKLLSSIWFLIMLIVFEMIIVMQIYQWHSLKYSLHNSFYKHEEFFGSAWACLSK